MKKVFKKKHFIIFEAANEIIVLNLKNKKTVVFKSIKIAKTALDLEIKKKLPKNPHLAKEIMKLTNDKAYYNKLKDFKSSYLTFKDFEQIMRSNSGIDSERCL